MILRKTEPRFFVGDGEYKTLDAAKEAELTELLRHASDDCGPVVTMILAQSARVIDILTTTETSLSKCRAVNGGRKPRKATRAEKVAAVMAKFDGVVVGLKGETMTTSDATPAQTKGRAPAVQTFDEVAMAVARESALGMRNRIATSTAEPEPAPAND